AQLYEWIMELHKDGFAINYSSIKMKMVEIMRSSARLAQYEAEKLAIANFKFLQHWLGHFLKCYDLFLCHKTNIKNNYPLGMIANMDETSVWFDIVGNLTANPRGIKTVHVQSTGNDKNRFTMVLTCLADGTKLSLVIIFKGKIWPANMPPSLVKGPHLKTMLVLDSFSAHISEQIKFALYSSNTDLAVISGVLLAYVNLLTSV
ncbi:19451_t:CDS:2, partial [Cetraspora pellucida]